MKKIAFIACAIISLTACTGSETTKAPSTTEEPSTEVKELKEETTIIEEKIQEVEASEEELNSALENL